MSEKELILSFWRQEHLTTVKVVRALPESKLNYRPHPRSRTALEIVWHVFCEERAAVEACTKGEIHWDETLPALDLNGMLEVYEKSHEELICQLEGMDDSTLSAPTRLLVGDQVVMAEPLNNFLWLTLKDQIHHRGQLSVYIRPMGGKVPSIYGPSADHPGQ